MSNPYKSGRHQAIERFLTEEQQHRIIERSLKQDIDKGWQHFWERRGITKPPYVSQKTVGMFDLPSDYDVSV